MDISTQEIIFYYFFVNRFDCVYKIPITSLWSITKKMSFHPFLYIFFSVIFILTPMNVIHSPHLMLKRGEIFEWEFYHLYLLCVWTCMRWERFEWELLIKFTRFIFSSCFLMLGDCVQWRTITKNNINLRPKRIILSNKIISIILKLFLNWKSDWKILVSACNYLKNIFDWPDFNFYTQYFRIVLKFWTQATATMLLSSFKIQSALIKICVYIDRRLTCLHGISRKL